MYFVFIVTCFIPTYMCLICIYVRTLWLIYRGINNCLAGSLPYLVTIYWTSGGAYPTTQPSVSIYWTSGGAYPTTQPSVTIYWTSGGVYPTTEPSVSIYSITYVISGKVYQKTKPSYTIHWTSAVEQPTKTSVTLYWIVCSFFNHPNQPVIA